LTIFDKVMTKSEINAKMFRYIKTNCSKDLSSLLPINPFKNFLISYNV
jgi:hypothetical protein